MILSCSIPVTGIVDKSCDFLVSFRHPSIICDIMSTNDVDGSKQIEEFARAGRTGRRNALPDIMSVPLAKCGTSELTKAMQQLQTSTSVTATGECLYSNSLWYFIDFLIHYSLF